MIKILLLFYSLFLISRVVARVNSLHFIAIKSIKGILLAALIYLYLYRHHNCWHKSSIADHIHDSVYSSGTHTAYPFQPIIIPFSIKIAILSQKPWMFFPDFQQYRKKIDQILKILLSSLFSPVSEVCRISSNYRGVYVITSLQSTSFLPFSLVSFKGCQQNDDCAQTAYRPTIISRCSQ